MIVYICSIVIIMTVYMLDSDGYLYKINIVNNITNATRIDNVRTKFKTICCGKYGSILLGYDGKLYVMKHNKTNFQVALNILVFDLEIINFYIYEEYIVLIDINYDAHGYNRKKGNSYIHKLGRIEAIFHIYDSCIMRLYLVDNKIYVLSSDNTLLEINQPSRAKTIKSCYLFGEKCVCTKYDAWSIDSMLINIFSKYDINVRGQIIDDNPLITKVKSDNEWIYTCVSKNLVISSGINLIYKIEIDDKLNNSVYVCANGGKYNIVGNNIIENNLLNNYYTVLPPKIFKKSANKFTH
jgi:hypothetical protein